MKFLPVLAVALALAVPAAAAFDSDAQTVLGKGKWGVVTGNLSPDTVAEARKCIGTSIMFAFSANEIQRITFENGQPPSGPPDFYADVKVDRSTSATIFSFFAAVGDAKPSAVYAYDPTVDMLTLMGNDGGGTALYVQCN